MFRTCRPKRQFLARSFAKHAWFRTAADSVRFGQFLAEPDESGGQLSGSGATKCH